MKKMKNPEVKKQKNTCMPNCLDIWQGMVNEDRSRLCNYCVPFSPWNIPMPHSPGGLHLSCVGHAVLRPSYFGLTKFGNMLVATTLFGISSITTVMNATHIVHSHLNHGASSHSKFKKFQEQRQTHMSDSPLLRCHHRTISFTLGKVPPLLYKRWSSVMHVVDRCYATRSLRT